MICTPCGAHAPDSAVSCGACGEGSWRRAAIAQESPTAQAAEPIVEPIEELAPTQPEPAVKPVADVAPVLPVVESAPVEPPSLFVEPAPAQRPQHQAGKHRHR